MEEKVTASPQYWVSSFGIFQVECHDLDVFEFGDMEKTRPVMGKWWIRIKCNTRAHLNTITLLYQRKKFASLQSISPLIQIWLSSGASETSCATNTIVYQMSTSGNQHTNWIGSEKVVLVLYFDWNLYLQVWAVDSYTEVFHTGETSVFPYIMLLTPIFGRFSKGIFEIFEEQSFSLVFVSELRKTKSQSCVRNRDCQLAFET